MKSLDSCYLFKKSSLEQSVTLIVRKLKERTNLRFSKFLKFRSRIRVRSVICDNRRFLEISEAIHGYASVCEKAAG